MSDAEATGFSRLEETERFSGWTISLVQATFESPDGRTFERDIVRHPGAVAVVAVDDQRHATLVRQYRPSVGTFVLEIPAGTCDVDGEEAEATARRELAEEAGLEARSWSQLATLYNSPGYCDQVTRVFLATGLTDHPTDRSGIEEEFMTVEVVDLADVAGLIAAGTVRDATTMVGLLLAERATPLGD
jgi:ADP-ribose pyrophosphatase